MVTLQARRLPAPILQFEGGSTNLNQDPTDIKLHNKRATWDLKNKKFFQVSSNPDNKAIRLGIIQVGLNEAFAAQKRSFQQELTVALKKYGYKTVHECQVEFLSRPPTKVDPTGWTKYMIEIDGAYDRLNKVGKVKSPIITIFILGTKDTSVYALLKCWSDLYAGVPAICVTSGAALKRSTYNDSKGDENTLANLWFVSYAIFYSDKC